MGETKSLSGSEESGRPMTSITVEAVELTKHYGAYAAVEAVSFSASQGEIVGILGPNGAGKTTTIRLLTTVLEPTSGEFSIAGHPSQSATEIRRCIGVLPEQRLPKSSDRGRISALLCAPLWQEPQSGTEPER